MKRVSCGSTSSFSISCNLCFRINTPSRCCTINSVPCRSISEKNARSGHHIAIPIKSCCRKYSTVSVQGFREKRARRLSIRDISRYTREDSLATFRNWKRRGLSSTTGNRRVFVAGASSTNPNADRKNAEIARQITWYRLTYFPAAHVRKRVYFCDQTDGCFPSYIYISAKTRPMQPRVWQLHHRLVG